MNRALFTALALAIPTFASADVPEIVRRNAPVFVSRKDQIANPNTDRILGVGYSIATAIDGTQTIRYTTFFSDEDSMHSTEGTDHQMARYGRRLDIEWTYEVRIDPQSGKGHHRRYHCDVALGVGHRTCSFSGKFYRDTDRPILYVNARHNIFGDRPKFPYGTASGRRTVIDPSFEIPYPKSRDMIPIENPEMLRTSDEELAREGKLSSPSTEYAYLRIRGTLVGFPHLSLIAPDGTVYQNGKHPNDTLREMGLDLWRRESVVGIELPESVRFALKSGVASFRLGISGALAFAPPLAKITLDDVGLYLVDRAPNGTYVTTDLSSRIRCSDPKDLGTCSVD
ncbi:MAG: hypothetical protein JST04_13950 [Bdellovibrionales bacterium]|nr:hypothetical protein [Bdellovibrionales bacterium]